MQLFVGVKASINCSFQILYLGLYNELILVLYTALEQFVHVPWYVLDVCHVMRTNLSISFLVKIPI